MDIMEPYILICFSTQKYTIDCTCKYSITKQKLFVTLETMIHFGSVCIMIVFFCTADHV